MKKTIIFCVIFLHFLVLSCSAIVNPTTCEMNVKQGNINIPAGTGYFDFGNIPNHLTQSISFTIENNGLTDLHLTGNPRIEITGQNDNEFSVFSNPAETLIEPGSSTSFDIQFKPLSLGSKSATISITNSDRTKNPYVFVVVGTCTEPAAEIHVKQGATDVLCTSGSYDFGSVKMGHESEKVTFTIKNIGNKNLILSGNPEKIDISGANKDSFEVFKDNLLTSIPSGIYTEFSIMFKPATIGINTAKISIVNNDSDENPYTFTITGLGYTSPEIRVKCGSEEIECNVGVYDFGKSKLKHTNNEVIFTIENVGTSILNLKNTNNLVSITGSDATSFKINTSTTASSIHPGNSTTFGITFEPTDEGDKTAQISIDNNDDDEDPFTFEIKGKCLIYDWTKVFGGPGSDYVHDMTYDNNQDCYIVGYFQGTVDFGSGFGATDTHTSKGLDDIFLCKINTDGSYCWTKTFGGPEFDWGYSVVTNSLGEIYITGFFRNTVNFGAAFGINDIKIAKGIDDAFITKINANGTYAWTKCIGGNERDLALSIAIDSDNNVYFCGWFEGTVDFADDFGQSNVKIALGEVDGYITKLDANGTYLWTKTMGGSSDDKCYKIAIDSNDNIYMTGWFNYTVNFGLDFGVSDIKTSKGRYDIFVMKIYSNGTFGWVKRIGGTEFDLSRNISISSTGIIYISGSFEGTVNFGEDFGLTDTKTSKGLTDIFITKINTNADYSWTKQIGAIGYDSCFSSTIDSSGNVYFSGTFNDTIDFGVDFGKSDTKISAGGGMTFGDAFVTKLDITGTYCWTKIFGFNGDDLATAVITDSQDNVYVGGIFVGSVDFAKDFGDSDTKNANMRDNFITKILQ